MGRVLLSAFFWLYLAVSLTAFWIFVVPIWLVVLPFDPRRRFSHGYATAWATHYIALSPFWRVCVRGREHLRGGPFVLVANHQSAADIIVLYALRFHFKWVSKASVFRIPFLGWMMWMADYVPVQRGRASSARMMERCTQHLRRGSSILIFPEGTRSKDAKLRPFKRGAFVLAQKAQVPLVPIVVDGTHDALPRKSWIFAHSGALDLRIHVLPPVDPAPFGGDIDACLAEVQRQMAAELAAMRGAPARPTPPGASVTSDAESR